MASIADIVIRNGTVIDGLGGAPFVADIAVHGERIGAIGSDLPPGRQEIDATGLIVTPGFVDVHTHYDGQATWSDSMSPSSGHGVTTVVIGNCGVGFAPCRAADREALVNVMEGVEDIPEAVMAEGLPWNWETFPEYLDALEARSWDVDVAAYIPHSPLRVHVMGQRGIDREPATATDLAAMIALVEEGMAAGAVGFATSRTLVHRTGRGDHIPSFDADSAELEAIAAAVGKSGRGVVQMVPNLGSPDWSDEIEMLVRLGVASGRPVTFTLAQSHQAPDAWRDILDRVSDANRALGTRLAPQVFPRPMGVIAGLSASAHPFCLCPSYAAIEALPLAERVAAMRDPALRATLLTETPADPANPLFLLVRNFERIYPMRAIPDYEPPAAASIAAIARSRGISPEEAAYDLLLEDDGLALLYVPFANYADQDLDAVLAMLRHDATVIGLGDGGAHYGLICDASYATTLLCHWTRDRVGERVSLPWAIKSLTADTADLVGLADRGRLKKGGKADINLIDYEKLTLHRPHSIKDLPAGGRRLTQRADGYRMTMLGGEIVQQDGKATGRRPGRLVRVH